MQLKDILSHDVAQRLDEMGMLIESADGDILTPLKQGDFELVKPTTYDGSIPDQSILPWKSSIKPELVNAFEKYRLVGLLDTNRRARVSSGLSNFLWSSEEGDDQIEIRSPVPDFPPPGQLTVTSSNDKRKKGVGEYCLAAGDDGRVIWVHESKCVINRNHVWTVHFFDLRGGGVMYFGDRLQRPVQNVSISFVNKIIGGNVNVLGTQNIGTVSCG